MEAAVAIGACVAVPVVYKVLRPRFKTKVNCWFCNKDTKVEYKNRNSFVCPSCQQYNGFNENGDYNRRIPGQSRHVPDKAQTRYCAPSASKTGRSDVIPDRFNNLNIAGGYQNSENGLCTECNANQETIMLKVSSFEPMNEDRWNEELEEYRYKLDRIYPLCPRCTLTVHGKLEQDKTQYSYLLNLRDRVKSVIGNTVDRVINPDKKRSRRRFFAGGLVCEWLRAVVLLLAVANFIAHLEHLQQDAEVEVLAFPTWLQAILPQINDIAVNIQLMILVAHIGACFFNKCRTTLPDLLLPVIALIPLATYWFHVDQIYAEDVSLCRCAFSSFVSVLAAAAELLPRKMKHRKRPNHIFSSAFSVASTPMSQCSSQGASRDVTIAGDSPTSRLFAEEDRVQQRREEFEQMVRVARNTPNLRWRERETTPFDVTRFDHGQEDKENEQMDWDDSETVSSQIASSQKSSITLKPGLFAQRMLRSNVREATPARELAPSVANMSLKTAYETSNGARDNISVFSHRSFATSPQPAHSVSGISQFGRPLFGSQSPKQNNGLFAKRANSTFAEPRGLAPASPAPSIFGARSLAAGSFQRNNNNNTPSPKSRGTASIFTSVSQQERDSTQSSWHMPLLVFFAATTLVSQIALVYLVFKK